MHTHMNDQKKYFWKLFLTLEGNYQKIKQNSKIPSINLDKSGKKTRMRKESLTLGTISQEEVTF